MPLSTTDLIAAGALIVSAGALVASVWTVKVTQRFNRKQIAFEKTAERLNLLLIEKEAAENQAQQRAEIGANPYRAGKSDTRLKIFNRGKAPAHNVRLEELESSGLLMPSDIQRKFPVDTLDVHASVELHLIRTFQSANKTRIQVTWDDGAGRDQTKVISVVI